MTEQTPEAPALRRPPSKALVVGVSVVAGGVDAWLVRRAPIGRVLISALFMAGFVYLGLRAITRVRFAVRPASVDPADREPSAAPPQGGWASPTSGQRFGKRAARMLDAMSRRRRP